MQFRTPPRHGATPHCLPGCICDHGSERSDEPGRYCRTLEGSVPAAMGGVGEVGQIEIGTDRYLISGSYADLAIPHRITLDVPNHVVGLTPAAAREFAWALLAQADRIERGN